MAAVRNPNSNWNHNAALRIVLFHPAVWLLATTAIMIVGAIVIWQKSRTKLSAIPELPLTSERIQISTPPAWADTKLDRVVLDSSPNASLLDRGLVSRAASALGSVKWIENITRIEKTRSGLIVDLRFRYPVAFVDLGNGQFQPVDREGVTMAPSCVAPEDFEKLMVISVPQPNLKTLQTWSVWPDQRIVGACAIAGALRSHNPGLGPFRIVSTHPIDKTGISSPFELWTSGGNTVIWGSPPGNETETEAPVDAKIAAVEKILMDELDGNQKSVIDVR